ncbi:hypothetical protein ADK76_22315 [Streptomyces griseoflavus]|uniref:hypothetical protein n=1 Tax=Streptomyces rimosus TaxID=1927 RepID=UPI0004C6A30E|nr:hypothetical protein [Streptomyces rimosus]KOG54919.1 hypothetical protein ADK76_22315 [Streptomyces griseoflavus]
MTGGFAVPTVVAATPAATLSVWLAGRFRRRARAGWERIERGQRWLAGRVRLAERARIARDMAAAVVAHEAGIVPPPGPF